MTALHFSPRPNRAHEIAWREWGEEAFQEAREANKPVLLSLSAVWCHWCHVMDETSYSDPGVIAVINERYVPIRVDNDERPDVNRRYNMGGWPTTAFLTPDGEILTGATYLPPDQMLEALPKVYTHFVSNRDEVSQKAVELRERRQTAYTGSGGGELAPAIFDGVLRSVVNAYDPLYGGFGEAPKFPHADSIDLLLYASRRLGDPDLLHMARKTLEMMCAGEVYDHAWNGFFRYATRRDWSDPHYEKMLEDNAGLLRNACHIYRITNREEHAEIARGIVAYAEWKLRDPERGYFFGSQDADEEFYKLDAEARKGHTEPYIDHTCYTSWNAQMISAYLEASWTLDRRDLLDAALKALRFLWDDCRDSSSGSMYRYHDGAPHVVGLLGDQAHTARALLDAAEATGDSQHIDHAVQLAELLSGRFHDDANGGFWDVWDEAPDIGLLRERQKSIQDNAVCADVFLRLHHLTREPRYLDIARAAVESFAGTAERMGYFAAGYAKVADLLLKPPAGAEQHRRHAGPATNCSAPRSCWTPLIASSSCSDPARDDSPLAALSLPEEPAPAAYLCIGTTCSAPVTSAAGLVDTVRQMQTMSGPRQITRPVTDAERYLRKPAESLASAKADARACRLQLGCQPAPTTPPFRVAVAAADFLSRAGPLIPAGSTASWRTSSQVN